MRYPLPNPVEPGSEICARISIPDAPEYIDAVTGQLFTLTRAYAWANDADHFAIDTAARMMTAFDTLSFSPDCDTLPVPNWFLDLNMVQGNYFADAWFLPTPLNFGGGVFGLEYYLTAWATGEPAELRFDISGKARADSSAVGGDFLSIVIANQQDPFGQTFHQEVENCDGTTPGSDETTPFTLSEEERRVFSFHSGNLTAFMFLITIKGDWTCVP